MALPVQARPQEPKHRVALRQVALRQAALRQAALRQAAPPPVEHLPHQEPEVRQRERAALAHPEQEARVLLEPPRRVPVRP